MCRVSDNLKLCSCKTENAERLKHYWILQRPIKRGDFTLGTIVAPADIGAHNEKYNLDSLRGQLNSGNCFDVDLVHHEKDILELHFTCKQIEDIDKPTEYSENYLVYAFVYRKGKWRKTSYDAFGNNIYSVQQGRILKPFIVQPRRALRIKHG